MSVPREPPSGCAYCGLPLARPWLGLHGVEEGPAYCCFGCRLAAEVTRSSGAEGAASWAMARLGLAVFFTMNVMAFTMALWSRDVYGPDAVTGALAGSFQGLFRYLCLLFALPVLLLLGGQLFDSAWDGLRRGAPGTDLLLVVGVAASYLYSAISVIRDDGPVYFEVGCMVLVLVTFGRWLEATGKLRAGEAIAALHRLLPDTVRRVGDDGETIVPLDQLAVGDRVRVLPGERIPSDGRILFGQAGIDEQVVTGESEPTVRGANDLVHAGTLDLDGELVLEATAPAGGGALARLIDMVETARRSPGRFERLADRVAAWFLPGVLLVALAAFSWHTYRSGLDRGLLTGLAVLLIACPCALGVATPLAVWAALGRAAQTQVLFRHGEALERLASAKAVRLDKTGTLTTGQSVMVELCCEAESDSTAVRTVASQLAAASTHAHARAVTAWTGTTAPERWNTRTLPGRGVEGKGVAFADKCYLGSPRLMDEAHLAWGPVTTSTVEDARKRGWPVTCVGWEAKVRGVFVLREELRPEAADAIRALRGMGLDVAVLSGDQAVRADLLGRELGVPVTAGLLPEEKVDALRQARTAFGPVAMVGDGINDAPALAASDVGVALGCGADVSREAALVCLLGDDLRRLPWAVELARRTVRTIRRNLFWAFAYNIVGIGFACTGGLNPVLAALAMVLSSLLVVGSSLPLAHVDEPVTHNPTAEEEKAPCSQPLNAC